MSIIVIDSIMGSGKSTWAKQYMNKHPEKRWLFVTPYLKEIEIVQKECDQLSFQQPTNNNSSNSKGRDLVSLLYLGKNIATTHSLFLRIRQDKVLLDCIREKKYNLIIDETLDVVHHEKITSDDINSLMAYGVIKIDDRTKTVNWIKEDYQGSHSNLKEYEKTGYIYSFKKEEAFVWLFNPHIFNEFDSIYLLTYIFEGTRMKRYFDFCNIQYQTYHIKDGDIIYGRSDNLEEKKIIGELIEIYNGNLNKVAEGKRAFYYLSKNWYNDFRNRNKIKQVRNNAYNYLHNIRNAKSGKNGDALYTIFVDINNLYPLVSYKKSFLQCNQKASNEYVNRKNLAYLVNIFEDPEIVKFFNAYNVEYDESSYALNSMIQWIWRSAIRNGEKIYIYIPSSRMRKLLTEWLNGHLNP